MSTPQSVNEQYSRQQHGSQSDKHYLVQVNNQYKCICQLCDCGKHKCPKPMVKGQFETSYNSHYKNTHLIIPTNPPPQYVYQDRHYHPESLKTNYKESFTDKPHIENNEALTKSRLENIGKSVLKPNIPFYGTTSYTDQFKPFSLQSNYNPEEDIFINKREKIPNYGFQNPAKFDDSTAYKEYYQAPTPIKLQKNPFSEYKKPEIPFQGSSSYKQQYKEYKIQPYQNYYNVSTINAPKVKFQDRTTYKDVYKDFKIMPDEPASGNRCQVQKMNIPVSHYAYNSSPHIANDQHQSRYK